MMFALVVDNSIVNAPVPLPPSARRLDTREWVMGLVTAPVVLQQACGYFVIAENIRPVDTATTTWDETFELVSNVPTQVWVERPFTAEETARRTRETNGNTLRDRAQTALSANATFLAIPSPTNAQVRDQVILLTKECNGIIRLLLGQLDSTDGT